MRTKRARTYPRRASDLGGWADETRYEGHPRDGGWEGDARYVPAVRAGWRRADQVRYGTQWYNGRFVERYAREDGAAVVYSETPTTGHPDAAGSRLWIAFEPDPSEARLARAGRRGRSIERRWGAAEAAMRAVDREYPLREAGA